MDHPIRNVCCLSNPILHRGRHPMDIFDGHHCQFKFRYVQQGMEARAKEEEKLRSENVLSWSRCRDFYVSDKLVSVLQRRYYGQRGRRDQAVRSCPTFLNVPNMAGP